MDNEAVIRERYKHAMLVFKSFSNAKIPFVIHKGVALSKLAYNDPFYRKSRDIDILIPREYCEEARIILNQQGFEQKRFVLDNLVFIQDEDKERVTNITHQMPDFLKIVDNQELPHIWIDVNLEIFWGRKRTDIAEFVSDRYEINLYDKVYVPILSPEKFFLATCLHHYRDLVIIYGLYVRNGYPKSHFEDIQGLLDNLSISFGKLIEIIEYHKASQYVYTCLYAAKQVISGFTGQALMDELYRPGFEDDFYHFGGLLRDNRYRWPENPVKIFYEGRTRETMDRILADDDKKRIHEIRISDHGYDDLILM